MMPLTRTSSGRLPARLLPRSGPKFTPGREMGSAAGMPLDGGSAALQPFRLPCRVCGWARPLRGSARRCAAPARALRPAGRDEGTGPAPSRLLSPRDFQLVSLQPATPAASSFGSAGRKRCPPAPGCPLTSRVVLISQQELLLKSFI